MSLEYYFSIVDSNGYTHSIDMVYLEWYSKCALNTVLEDIRHLHDKYPLVRYEEYLDRKRNSKYDFYLDGVVFGGSFINLGKYTNYDKVNKTFDIFPMFQLRVNPNKYMFSDWFIELKSLLMSHGVSGYIRKYDYAVDVPVSPDKVKVFYSRKEFGLYKGTRYYGQAGRHNYCKIYDKQRELAREQVKIDPLTRVEYTLFSGQIPNFENIYVLSEKSLETANNKLKDTDRAIIEMYMQLKAMGIDYDLKLGRGKMEKLSPYLFGGYQLLEYGDILNYLLCRLEHDFDVSLEPDEIFIPVEFGEELPFD